ncbi:magnesium transporter [Candidatus Cardinium hertigii]|uniref:Magnesium transporter MgtE n=1 Tax=Candidatus Cardinium hertigii TaxID=247481 RepID=A0A3N2QBH9_9BACT|nr:magnesium transporter [Candidatus Cardinium hertigii]ROT47155.1 magnesium transporter [Candidatus Cardinium hertigii]
MKQKGDNKFVKWMRLLKQQQDKRLIYCLERTSPIEVARFLEKQSIDVIIRIFSALPVARQGEIFALFNDSGLQMQLYGSIPKSIFAKIFSCMPSDLRVDFYQRLSGKEHAHLLPYLSRKVREDVIMLNAYSPDTAGGIMSTDFATVLNAMTVEEAIAKIREDAPSKKMLYYIYVVNEKMKLVGFISLKDLVMHAPQERIDTILKTNFLYATVDEDQEAVAKKIEQYDLVAIPILNHEKQIVGIVSYDDAIDIIRAEQVEDMDKFMGITSEEDEPDYLKISSAQHLKKRIKWIIGVFMLGIVSQIFLHYKGYYFGQFNLMFYVGMIGDTGGNVGTQAASVVLQALNRGQVTLSDWVSIILKEIRIAIMLASILFFLVFIKMFIVGSIGEEVTRNYRVVFVVALSIVFQVIGSAFIGASLPLAAKYLKGDPAVAANPAISTIVELLGLIIYYVVICWLLHPATDIANPA